jgi:tetratricopeptide (TPR) repeat protein
VTGTSSEDDGFEIDISFEFPEDGAVFASPEVACAAGSLSQDAIAPESVHGDVELQPDFDDLPDFSSPEAGPADTYDFAEPEKLPLQEEPPDAFDFFAEETVVPLVDTVPDAPGVTAFEHLEIPPAAIDSFQPDPRSPELVFSRFMDVPTQDYEQGDTETHYNLGIAYMEMGLHDEAVKEFRVSANDPDRKLDSLTLQGLCFREQENYADAEDLFAALLSLDALGSDRIVALRYELGLLFEAAGRKQEALQVFREIFGNNPGFRDTMQKIAFLSGKESSFDLSDLDEADIELEELV